MSRAAAARKGHVTRSEREEAVTVNLPPDLLPLWHRVKAGLRGTPDQRREAFLQYAHDHAGEAVQAMAIASDGKVAEIVRARVASPPPAEPETVVYVVGTRKGWQVRTDAPRYYAEDGRTFAYWRGAGAFAIGRGTLDPHVRALPGEVAAELARLQASIEALQEEHRALLDRSAKAAPLVPMTAEVPF